MLPSLPAGLARLLLSAQEQLARKGLLDAADLFISPRSLEIMMVNYTSGLGNSFSPWNIYVSDFTFLKLFCLRNTMFGHLTL